MTDTVLNGLTLAAAGIIVYGLYHLITGWWKKEMKAMEDFSKAVETMEMKAQQAKTGYRIDPEKLMAGATGVYEERPTAYKDIYARISLARSMHQAKVAAYYWNKVHEEIEAMTKEQQ